MPRRLWALNKEAESVVVYCSGGRYDVAIGCIVVEVFCKKR